MTDITFTRFDIIPSGYRRHDSGEFAHGLSFSELLNATIEVGQTNKEPRAWSFSKFKSGKMSGETWQESSAVLLEYHQGSDPAARYQELTEAADKLFYAYYVIDTETRKGQRTFTLVFPLAEKVEVSRYVRIASVLATQIGAYDAAHGIKAHTHLVHVHANSAVEYREGPVINPTFFIKMTKHQAQNFDVAQFERPRPALIAQIAPPVFTTDEVPQRFAADDGLFAGL